MPEGLLLGWMVQTMRIPPVLSLGQVMVKDAALLVAMVVLVQDGAKARRARSVRYKPGLAPTATTRSSQNITVLLGANKVVIERGNVQAHAAAWQSQPNDAVDTTSHLKAIVGLKV
eukprot:m.221410 g.221410  ORF g.221410 m.221410 type:complete len:116 (+) comp17248_c0_seq3:1996-2343(+)